MEPCISRITCISWTFFIILHIYTSEAIFSKCTISGTSHFCSGIDVNLVVSNLNTNISELHLIASDLTALRASDFTSFQNIRSLYLINCTIPRGVNLLSDLKDLKALQITYSDLSDDIAVMFTNNTALNTLSLQWNGMTRVSKTTFRHLQALEALDVSNNAIAEVEEGAWEGLQALQKLDLGHNALGGGEPAFDPAFLALPSGRCGVCGGGVEDEGTRPGAAQGACSADATARCLRNAAVADHLWTHFEARPGALRLHGNPLCAAVRGREESAPEEGLQAGTEAGTEAGVVPEKEFQAEEGAEAGCVLFEEGRCSPEHDARERFLFDACDQDVLDARKRDRKHLEDEDDDEDWLDSGEEDELPVEAVEPLPTPSEQPKNWYHLTTAGWVMMVSGIGVVALPAIVTVLIFKRRKQMATTSGRNNPTNERLLNVAVKSV